MAEADVTEKPRETVEDLLDRIGEGDAEARAELLAHMANLANRSRHEGYRQAKREMLLAVNELELCGS